MASMTQEECLIDYYDILGCTRKSSHEEIKRAYHGLALKHHPDKCASGIENNVEFHRVQQAWKILGDLNARKEYDTACKQAEHDSESNLVYARISLGELEAASGVDEVDEDATLVYQCRCGGFYSVEKKHLLERNSSIHVSCQECTFLLVVET